MQSVEEYLDEIRPYLKDVINNLKKISPWKINFISSRDDYDEERVMHSKSDNIEIMISDEADEVITKLFHLLKNKYQNIWNHSKVVILSLFIHCIINVTK